MRPAGPGFWSIPPDENGEGSVSRSLSHEENQLGPPPEHRTPCSVESLANHCFAASGHSNRADKQVGERCRLLHPESSLPSQQRRQEGQESKSPRDAYWLRPWSATSIAQPCG